MLRLLLFCVIAHTAFGFCPSGFELVRDGECRGSVANMTLDPVSNDITQTTIEKCGQILSQPVIIHNDEEQSYWTKRGYEHPNAGDRALVLGIFCNTTSHNYEWVDGSSIDFKPSSYYKELDSSPCSKNYHFYIESDGMWNGWGNSAFMVDVSCTTQLKQPVPSPDGCVGFEDDSDDGQCYQVGATAENWQDAQMNCKKVGANLASIHNVQENSFVRRLAVSNGATNGLYLGATVTGKGKDFGWIDGSAWDYQNFYSGFPMTGTGDCLAMDTSVSSGQWMNIECSTKLPVACIRDPQALINVTEPSCATGPYYEGAIITSPGFPFDASMPCDFFLTADEGKVVEAEIVMLEANSCCDFLVIHDGFLGGNMIANLTGELRNVTYTSTTNFMRVSWQPNGGVNVRGLAMTYTGV